jgi:tetratricopeptide (TPR) repeat protein
VSPHARVTVVVALAAAAAVGATLGVTAITHDSTSGATAAPARRVTCPKGPPLQLDLGVRTDGEAVALRRAQRLYAAGRRPAAGRLRGRYASIEARVGMALATWPRGTVASLRRLAAAHPASGDVRLHLGLALACSGRHAAAESQWRTTARVAADTSAAIRAGDLLHPQYAPGVPVFLPTATPPRSIAALPPERQLAELARRARGRDVRAKLLYGWVLQRLGHQVSAERVYVQAAALAPQDPEAQAAAAVGRFDKDRPARAFSRLGPLTRRFPRAATVRYHLGLLLLWIGQVNEGKRQLRLATRLEPASVPGREAARFLDRLGGT